MKLLLDEHLSPTIAEELRRRGHDVVAVIEVGLRQQPDVALLAWAVDESRAVVTANYADFRALHAALGRFMDAIERLLKENPEDLSRAEVPR